MKSSASCDNISCYLNYRLRGNVAFGPCLATRKLLMEGQSQFSLGGHFTNITSVEEFNKGMP